VRSLLVLLLLSSGAAAQVVRVANRSGLPFDGWHRTTVDVCPPHAAALVGDVFCVRGRPFGTSTWVVDLHLTLAPFQERTLDLSGGTPIPWTFTPLTVDPLAFFGGSLTMNGQPLHFEGATVDGATAVLRFQGRIAPMLLTDVWMLWRPEEPGLMRAECVVTASNPGLPDVTVTTPPGGLNLAMGDARVHVPGAGWQVPVVPGGVTMGNGQSRAVPVVFVWLQHLYTPAQLFAAIAAVTPSIYSVGIDRLLPNGNPSLPAGFSALAWTIGRFQESLRRLHTWEAGVCGPNPASGDTGAQEDQVFVRGEPCLADGAGSEQMAYYGALKMFNRPCHHLEADGRIVDPALHTSPRLVYWDGHPHWNTTVSPDQLGKPAFPTAAECSGWSGPDVEHWLINTLAAGARYTGSYALQWELRHQAMLYLGCCTTDPGLSTSQPFAARAVGWEGIVVSHLWNCLEDRDLADRVRVRWIDRVNDVILPAYGGRVQWDVRLDDVRLGPGAWWIPWQQSVGAYGIDLACEQLGPLAGRWLARDGAQAVLDHAWVWVNGRWQSRAAMPVAGGGTSNEEFNFFGMSMSVAVALRHDPSNLLPNWIWWQLRTDDAGHSWLAPGIW